MEVPLSPPPSPPPRSRTGRSTCRRKSSGGGMSHAHARSFPSVDQPRYVDPALLAAVPERPIVRTTFDKALVASPLDQWEAHAHIDPYVVDVPPLSAEPYLFPRLTKNERNRLQAVWYYTRGIQLDRPFLAHLRETLDLVQDLIPHDAIILGLMDKDVYTRLVTTNVPLAILPRREATCAHTINMPAGSVLSLPDMPNDPRFAQSPHVAQGGLVSYAGTPLRFSLVRDDGTREDVIFGTLCAASFKHAPALGAVQQRTMARFADIIVYDIVERARNVRVTDRHTMASRLASITSQVNTHNAVEVVLGTLRETYPHAAVALQHRPDDMIELDRLGAVPYTVFEDYLYENVAQIEADILAHNHLPAAMHTVGPTLRAIAIRHSAARHTYLVVQTARLTDIFDDVDTAFVHSCALILCNVAQAAELEQIMAARVSFLRSVSHDLRTPIHALLSSCELLVEDARAARATLSVGFAADGTASTEHAALLENALASGRALMSAVNNLLNFDALGTIVPTPWPFALSALEAALLSQTGLALAERGRPVQLVCENVLPPDVHMLNGDLDLYKQALGALLDNAVAFTAAGAITLRTALGADGALVFDVRDTGPGVAEARREHIFAVFDKGHAHGVGLGLPVAQRVTRALGGELALVETGPNGSWFRMQIEGPGLACQLGHPARRLVASDALRTFAFGAAAAGQRAEALRATLCAVGLEEADMQRANLVVIYAGALTLAATLAGVRERQVVVLLHEDEAEAAAAERAADAAGLRSRCVPMPALVGAEALWTGLGAALDVREAAIAAIMPREPSPISDVRSAAASTLPDSTLSNRVTRPARPALRILIVDDNRTNLDILRMYSRRRGHTHVAAMDGAQAVDAYVTAATAGAPLTLVLMDLQMPVMDGAEATRRIRAHEAAHGLWPCLIFMVSGQSHDNDKLRAIDAGADGYYVKPLGMRTIDDLISLHFPP